MKLYLVLFAAVVAAQVALINGFEGRVTFGNTMTAAEQPKFNYQLDIHAEWFGAGVLVAPNLVLTAAHVVSGDYEFGRVCYNTLTRSQWWEDNCVIFKHEEVVIHKNYTDPNSLHTLHYDIALIPLEGPLPISKNVGTIGLASKYNFDCENVDATAWISGHGSKGPTTEAQHLSDFELSQMRYAKTIPLPLEECRRWYPGLNEEPTQLCSLPDKSKGSGGVCAGDSGGPYAFDNPNDPDGKRILCGLASFALNCETTPSGYISVPYFVDNGWICENSRGLVGCDYLV